MKTKKLFMTAIAATALTLTACGNKVRNADNVTTTEQTAGVLEVDSLLMRAEALTNQEVTIEGVCTHACKHGATKIFLMGSDDT